LFGALRKFLKSPGTVADAVVLPGTWCAPLTLEEESKTIAAQSIGPRWIWPITADEAQAGGCGKTKAASDDGAE